MIKFNEPPPFGIVIPTFNRLEFTKQCFDALFQYTDFDLIHKLIVFDNFSTDGTYEYVKKLGCHVIQGNFTNANFCLNIFCDLHRYLPIQYLIKLDNDIVVHKDWLYICYGFLRKHPKTGTLFYCKRVGPHYPKLSNQHGGNFITPFPLIKNFGLFSTSGKYPGCHLYHNFVVKQGYLRYSLSNLATDISWNEENIDLVKLYASKNLMRPH